MYHRLENSIIDVIKEEQAKLGYRKEEIRLYYPLSSLDHFFETSADAEEMKKILAGFGAYTKEKLGNVLVSNKGDRFCFHIPEQDRKSTRLNSSHWNKSRMPSSA